MRKGQRKGYFWIFYIVIFVILAWIDHLIFQMLPTSFWSELGFILSLFFILSPIATIIATKITNRFFG